MKQPLQAVWRFILETLFPAFCLGCRREGTFLCGECLAGVPKEEQKFIRDVGCFALDGLIACSPYEDGGLLARLIHALKYEFIEDLALPLGGLMAAALPDSLGELTLCPVPLHPKRFRWRGFNQSELLAKVVSQKNGIPVASILERTSFKKPQMELSRTERLTNVYDAFRVKADVSGMAHVILLDDVATTFATLEACASTLKRAGVPKVTAIVLARVH